MFGSKKIKNMQLIDPSNSENRHLEPTHLISYDWIESLEFISVKNFNLAAVTRKFKNLHQLVIRQVEEFDTSMFDFSKMDSLKHLEIRCGC